MTDTTTRAGSDTKSKSRSGDRVVIKKYANRRLYNTASSSYVTLEHLSEMVKEGVDFVVYDAKTNEDITRSVLTQIIFEEESRGQNLLPIQFLRQLIRFYGDQMQSFVPTYLEMSLEAFARQQERMQEQMSGALGQAQGFGLFEEQVRQNLALFDRAMKMFTPFAYPPKGGDPRTGDLKTGDLKTGDLKTGDLKTGEPPAAPAAEADGADQIQELRRQMEEMQRKLAQLSDKG